MDECVAFMTAILCIADGLWHMMPLVHRKLHRRNSQARSRNWSRWASIHVKLICCCLEFSEESSFAKRLYVAEGHDRGFCAGQGILSCL